jgi:hypothetical protein
MSVRQTSPRPTARWLPSLTAALVTLAAAPPAPQPTTTFTDYTPLASNPELARRLLTPLTAARLPQLLAAAGKGLRDQPVELAQERFTLHVPPSRPPGGYGLMVFVAPWGEAGLPPEWGPVLDRAGIIFVSAVKSGNDQSPLGRREPQATMAAWCVLGVETHVTAFTAHEIAKPAVLERALAALEKPVAVDAGKLAACRAGVERELDAALGRVEALLAAGKRDEARGVLAKVDERFGGLAAPRSLALAGR